MSDARFWVVGGEYRSLAFEEVIDGTQTLVGPFHRRDAAERSWRELSEEHRARCNMRFTIAEER
jgi:hypothetical protein